MLKKQLFHQRKEILNELQDKYYKMKHHKISKLLNKSTVSKICDKRMDRS